jgi:uncharacterized membrane protein YjfL (UPF0719 family)
MNWERLGRAAGIGFVVFTAAAFVVGGEPPKVSDSADDVVSYFTDDRSQVLVSSFLFAVALVLFLWFAGTVANLLLQRGEGRVAATALAAGTTWVVIQLVLTAITAALAHSIASDGDATGARALFSLSWVLDMMGALPIAGFVLAVSLGLRRTHAIPEWLSWGGLAVAVLLALRSTTWARDGFWSPTGEYLFIVIPLALLFVLITSIVLVRASAGDEAAARSPDASVSTS